MLNIQVKAGGIINLISIDATGPGILLQADEGGCLLGTDNEDLYKICHKENGELTKFGLAVYLYTVGAGLTEIMDSFPDLPLPKIFAELQQIILDFHKNRAGESTIEMTVRPIDPYKHHSKS